MAAMAFIAACEKVDIKESEQDSQQLVMSVTKVSFPHEGGSFCISIDNSLEYEVETGADWIVIGENCSTPSETLHAVVSKNTTPEPILQPGILPDLQADCGHRYVGGS